MLNSDPLTKSPRLPNLTYFSDTAMSLPEPQSLKTATCDGKPQLTPLPFLVISIEYMAKREVLSRLKPMTEMKRNGQLKRSKAILSNDGVSARRRRRQILVFIFN
ncbi:hypothetical protein GYMLUDRAFT_896487 [Collybiopsis luxurians FD-317 M1]|uniref:Uncharacterized protein n=1 Tax=Collybiopsis luxurians FD-317 M1 TaxID=944289 RepID=A0A0D0BXR6_9AGAR|nr:hypothetical protein GYMLUDRAFT_896487 [Collybiopsis luxurians FD-317 M1]